MKTKLRAFRLSDEVIEDLDVVAEWLGTNRTEVIRYLVGAARESLKLLEEEPQDVPTPPG